MKKFFESVALIKGIAGMVFAGQVILFTVIGSFFGLTNISFSFIWQALVIALLTSVLQFIAFTDTLFVHMKYATRLMIFALPLFVILTGFAIYFEWFPFSAAAWLIFTGIFLFVFGIITTVIELYARITGKKYNERLASYKRKAE